MPVASFSSSILSSKDHPSLVIGALQLTDLLLTKVPKEYRPAFRREGVFHEISALADRPLTPTKSKDKDAESSSDTPPPGEASGSAAPPAVISAALMIPGYRKLAQLSLEPDDAITLRARVIRFKHLEGHDKADENANYDALRRIVDSLTDRKATEVVVNDALHNLADLFATSHTSMSSFELMQSGIIDCLLQFTTDIDRPRESIVYASERGLHFPVPLERRTALLMDIFTAIKGKRNSTTQTPLAIFVKKLQESLTRMESYDVVTVAQADGMRCLISFLHFSA